MTLPSFTTLGTGLLPNLDAPDLPALRRMRSQRLAALPPESTVALNLRANYQPS